MIATIALAHVMLAVACVGSILDGVSSDPVVTGTLAGLNLACGYWWAERC